METTTLTQKTLFAISLGSLCLASQAFAKPAYLTQFNAQYPNATSLHNCKTCHDTVPNLNPYGAALKQNINGDDTINFVAVEGINSDGVGNQTNLEKINAGVNPGTN